MTIFPLRRKSEKKRRRTEVTEVIGRCTGRGHGMTGRVRSVQMQQSDARVLGFTTGVSGHSRDRHVRSGAQRELQFARSIGHAARPVTRDRTRPVVEGAY
jgi:hypothetical protein